MQTKRKAKVSSAVVVFILAAIVVIIQNIPSGVTVTRVIDGDTIEVEMRGETYKVRLIGINTPESTTRIESYGKEASNFTKSQLLGKKVYLEKDVSETDKYGRLLRYVWLKKPSEPTDSEIRTKMFNAILVLEGYAQAATYPPDVKYAEYFAKYEAEARENNRGLWALEGKTESQNLDRIVYWTPNGKSYHYSKDCPLLQKSKTINQGTLQEAIDIGKSDPCNYCVK
ncbi:MAG TPA: thermonuclease family protein [Fervidobacterium sp.]|nr:thermonuclease family protein [Fervidobacterium sp.]HQQ17837.1 thermonuclease family protein [Fervidobacterium sp.]